MRINDLLGDDENILWEHLGDDGINIMNSGFGKKALPVILLLISIILFCVIPMIMGMNEKSMDALSAEIYMAVMLAFIVFMNTKYKHMTAKQKRIPVTQNSVRYCITQKGIYIEKGTLGNEQTEFIRFGRIVKAGIITCNDETHAGCVALDYKTTIQNVCFEERMILHNLPDCNGVLRLITVQKERLENKVNARTQRNLPGEAEMRSVSKPVEANSMDSIKHHVAPVKSNRTHWAPKTTAIQPDDAQAAFFGNIGSQLPMPGKTASFLESDIVSVEDSLAALPDDSVSDLQAELFGADAVQQTAYPDSAVNPLSGLSESEQLRSFTGCSNSTSPYALQQTRTGLWGSGQEPEMSDLIEDPLQHDFELPMQ